MPPASRSRGYNEPPPAYEPNASGLLPPEGHPPGHGADHSRRSPQGMDPSSAEPAQTEVMPSERTGLLSTKNSGSRLFKFKFNRFILSVLVVAAMLSLLVTHYDSDQHERRISRRDWAKEQLGHEAKLENRNKREREERAAIRAEWDKERRDHEAGLENRNRREREEQARERAQWDKERRDHEITMARLRAEREAWQTLRQREIERWEEERRKWTDEDDQRRREEEAREREKQQLYWSLPNGGNCLAYNKREYKAQLHNVPTQYDWVYDSCISKSITIDGKTLEHPDRCENEGVYAYWALYDDEPECKTYWNTFRDKGCVGPGSGKRRHEARLNNFRDEDNWRAMCATTPREINGILYHGAHYCSEGADGVRFGYWEVDDDHC